jgi:hypothetical protein
MIEIPKGNQGEKGKWNVIANPRYRKNHWCEFTCPFGHGATLAKNIHTIAEDGAVSPSVICPRAEDEGCTFHEFVKLLDWKPEYANSVVPPEIKKQ